MESSFEKEEIIKRLKEKYGAELALDDSVYDVEAYLEESLRTNGQLPFGFGVTVMSITEAITTGQVN